MITFFKIFSGPLLIVFTYIFFVDLFPQLNVETQNLIYEGPLGALIGFVGSGIILTQCIESGKTLYSLFKKNNINKNNINKNNKLLN